MISPEVGSASNHGTSQLDLAPAEVIMTNDIACMHAQIERDEYLRPFQGYTNRYRHSYEASYSQDPLYYSNDVGRAPLF